MHSTPEDGEVLLTDLCAICHNDPFKYTCPRCGIHTCSLQCVKRHKSWAQCDGVRNPAAYRKRADLATESSIDQDFNFITKVERSLTRADDEASEKGIFPAQSHVKFRNFVNRPRFDIEVEDRGIKLIRAPQGLSRSKQNKSHWAGQQKGLIWSIEWNYHDGSKIFSNTPETMTIVQAYTRVFGQKLSRHKRKRGSQNGPTGASESIKKTSHSESHTQSNGDQDIHSVPKAEKIMEDEPVEKSDNLEDALQTKGKASSDQKVESGVSEQHQPVQENSPGNVHHELAVLEGWHFYLHRPQTTSKLKCLVELSPDTTIIEALRNRTLLEFPTIYIRAESSRELAAPFISEEEYDRAYGANIPIDLPLFNSTDNTGTQPPPEIEQVDGTKLLDVLRKDLGG